MSTGANSILGIQTTGGAAQTAASTHSEPAAGDGVHSGAGGLDGTVQVDLSGFAAKTWVPHDYQQRAVEWLVTRPEGALFLPPGMGKTSCSLEAFITLRKMGYAKKMLILAPKKVCEATWPAEISKWFQFQGLTVGFAHGEDRVHVLKAKLDIVLLNYDGLAWAHQHIKPGMFDILLCDEITKLKNHKSKRFEYIKPLLPHFRFRWGLTGSPAANGLIDLFGQVYILDQGRRLGRYITHYRMKYFHQKPNDDYGWYITPEKSKMLIERLEDMAMYLDPKEWLNLPELLTIPRPVYLDKADQNKYEELEDQFIIKMEEAGYVTAANAGVLTSKLRQFTGGGIYQDSETWHRVHDKKLDALEDLVDELAGAPLMVAYQFEHELIRLKERFPKALVLKGGMNSFVVKGTVDMWNSGAHEILLVQPSSAAHGLNLQFGGAAICWFTLTYNYEEYSQLIARIYRQGQTQRVFNYILAADKTIDARVARVLSAKDVVQEDLFKALKR